MTHCKLIGFLAFGLSAVAMSSTTLAQESGAGETGDNYMENLQACQAVQADTERLRCYDNAVARVVTASEAGEVRLVDRGDVDKTRRRLFGFSLPDLGIFGSGDEGELELLESKVTRVISINRNKITFEIEEGSVWYISDAPSRVIRRLEPGASVAFKKAALGSYFIRVEGMTGVKGKRVD
uniref:hypothetical protein n=1 Tax=Parerythrobacter lutipelagi TaxID=1964208 RepID=UPI0010F77871|nr:hypothetical protein [Parerythrobacter lutipelagi]